MHPSWCSELQGEIYKEFLHKLPEWLRRRWHLVNQLETGEIDYLAPWNSHDQEYGFDNKLVYMIPSDTRLWYLRKNPPAAKKALPPEPAAGTWWWERVQRFMAGKNHR